MLLEMLALLPDATPAPAPVDPAPGVDLSWLGPTIAAGSGIIVAAIGGISLVWRRRQDRVDQLADKAADNAQAMQLKPVDSYEEVRRARAEATFYYNLYRGFENLYYGAINALRHLVRLVRGQHPDLELDKEITDALAAPVPDTTLPK